MLDQFVRLALGRLESLAGTRSASSFALTSIYFKRSFVVPEGNDLLEVDWHKGCNGAGLFVLVNMPEFMRQKPDAPMPLKDVDSMTQR